MAKHAQDRFQKETKLIHKMGLIFRASDALKSGISRKALYGMRDLGIIEPLSRGLYRLSSSPQLTSPDLVTVTRRAPTGVICLISALSFHKLTTQIPHEIHLAVQRGKNRPPRIDYPPVRIYQFSDAAFTEGIEIREVDDTKVRIYTIEKTIADAFKFRGKIGLDLFLEALNNWRRLRRRNLPELLRFAKINRVEKQIRPYLEVGQ